MLARVALSSVNPDLNTTPGSPRVLLCMVGLSNTGQAASNVYANALADEKTSLLLCDEYQLLLVCHTDGKAHVVNGIPGKATVVKMLTFFEVQRTVPQTETGGQVEYTKGHG